MMNAVWQMCLPVLSILPLLWAAPTRKVPEEIDWSQIAQERISRNSIGRIFPQPSVAKNVILFIGDGMGLTTVTASRLLKQSSNRGGESLLSWDNFEQIALAKTYNLDSQVGDSGACATALMCGVKANFETVGVGAGARLNDCASALGDRLSSIAEWAQQEGKATGFVTTTRVTHATPAAFYAHSPNRYWESDDRIPQSDADMCKDIARQLIEDEPGKNLNVIMGGGRRHLVGVKLDGRRKDGKNLIETWLEDKQRRGLPAAFVANQSELQWLDTGKIDYLMGIFSMNHMSHEADRNQTKEPSLAEMTVKAVNVLKHNPNGFLLMVESGRIDHAHHLNNAYRALTDTLALDETVESVARVVNQSNTLMVVTADHSHVFTFGGFPQPGASVLGFDSKLSDVDHLPYTTLLYANGPGYRATRTNLTNVQTGNSCVVSYKPLNLHLVESKDYVQEAAVPKRWETHGGEDVPVYATGPGSNLFAGVIDQTFIPYALAYAGCFGPVKEACLQQQQFFEQQPNCGKNSTTTAASARKQETSGRGLYDFLMYNVIQQVTSDATAETAAAHWWPLLFLTIIAFV